ncbi:MAG TPA: OB-fold domain-containing protein [Alphaproteobacteria bacterium]|jgi:uncharacterized OB-fold protein
MRDEKLEAGARGTLVTFTVIRKAPAAFATEPLYAVAIVDLEGGQRIVGRIEPFEPAPRLGAPVTLARFAKDTPVFAPLLR